MKMENVTAGSMVEEDFFSVSENDEVREVLNRIKKEEAFAVPVMGDAGMEGIITWRKIIQKSTPPETKVGKLVMYPPKVQKETNMVDVADKMLETGSRAIPVMDDDNLMGILTQNEIIKAVSKDKRFEDKGLEDIVSDLVSINNDETLGKAKAMMRKNRVARLPVVDDDGDLVGSIDMGGLVKTFTVEDALTLGDRKGTNLPESEMDLTSIMNRNPVTVDISDSVKNASGKISRSGSLYSVVMDGDEPVGIITPKDITEMVASLKKEEGAYVQIAGAGGLDTFERDKVLDVAERSVKKAGRMFNNVENLIVHIKEQNADGGRTQYSVRSRIFTSAGLFTAKEDWEWNLLDAVDNCLDKLEKRFKKFHGKRKDTRRSKGS